MVCRNGCWFCLQQIDDATIASMAVFVPSTLIGRGAGRQSDYKSVMVFPSFGEV